jgi:membrane-associated phospholipid phosphatase
MERRAWLTRMARAAASVPVLVLALGLAVVTVLSAGPLLEVDRTLNHPWSEQVPGLQTETAVLAGLGQRAYCLPLLALVAAYYARRLRSWEPVVLSAGGVLAVNLLVGGMKILTARDSPHRGDPSFFNEGLLYPSGHAANVVLVYGLTAYLVVHYGRSQRRTARVLGAAVLLLAVVMTAVALYTRDHWFTDMVGGFVAGALVLRLVVDVHRSDG